MSMPSEEPWYSEYYTIDTNGCWIWQGRIDPGDYGTLYHNGKHEKAHRVFWELHRGPIPEGKKVLHSCDVRPCVNPNHLFLGTQQDNVDDMVKKGRHVASKGARNGNARLTEDQVIEILALIDEGKIRQVEIAALYGIAHTTVSYIKYKGWRHLKENE